MSVSVRINETRQCTPVIVIASDIGFINKRIRKSQYFYINIKREGVMLYDMGNFSLDEAKELTAQERHHLPKEGFDYWISKVRGFVGFYHYGSLVGELNLVAFQLHHPQSHFIAPCY